MSAPGGPVVVKEELGSTPHCPLCREALENADDEPFSCPACETLYHLQCAREMGGCSALGCERKGWEIPSAEVMAERLAALKNLQEEEAASAGVLGGEKVWLLPGIAMALLFLAPLTCFVAAIPGILAERERQQWPTTMGKVVETSVKESVHLSDEGSVTYYFPSVRYSYVVDGATHSGVHTGETSLRRAEAQSRASRKFAVGAEVAVYFDPADPNESGLDRKGPPNQFLGAAMALGTFVLLLTLMVGAFVWSVARSSRVARAGKESELPLDS